MMDTVFGFFPNRAAWVVLPALVGCGSPERPAADAPPEEGPEEGVEPGPRPQVDLPAACVRTPAQGGFEIVGGVTEMTRRRVAASAGSAYVMSDFVVRRAPGGTVDFAVVRDVPGRTYRQIGATAGRVFVLSDAGLFTSEDEGETFVEAAGPAFVRELRASEQVAIVTDTAGEIWVWEEARGTFVPLATSEPGPVLLAASDGDTVLADTGQAVFRSQAASDFAPVLGLEPWGYRDLVIAANESVAITIFGDLRVSSDGGATFSVPAEDTAVFGPASRVAAAGDGFVASTTAGIVYASDSGSSWTLVAPAPSADGAADVAAQGSTVIASTPEVRLSSDGGATFSATADIHDATVIGLTPLGPWLFASTADRRVHVTNGGFWQDLETGGQVVREADQDGDRSYLLLVSRLPWEPATYGHQLFTSQDGALSFEPVAPPTQVPSSTFDAIEAIGGVLLLGSAADPVVGDPFAEIPLGRGVYRSLDGGQSWSASNAGLPTETGIGGTEAFAGVVAIESDHDDIVVLLADGSLHHSVDLGLTWQPAGDGVEPGAALDTLRATSDGILAASSTEPGRLYRFDRAAASWSPLAASGLPADFTLDALLESGGLLAAGVRSADGPAVYVSIDGGASFTPAGLNAEAISLAVFEDALYAGTFGEGLHEVALAGCE